MDAFHFSSKETDVLTQKERKKERMGFIQCKNQGIQHVPVCPQCVSVYFLFDLVWISLPV